MAGAPEESLAAAHLAVCEELGCSPCEEFLAAV
jgi:hypothetical protein